MVSALMWFIWVSVMPISLCCVDRTRKQRLGERASAREGEIEGQIEGTKVRFCKRGGGGDKEWEAL